MLEPSELFPEVQNLYEFPSVHADMLFDEYRVSTYKRAIDSTIRKGDVVVDVGAGTGLLSFLSLQAGAAKVHAIERSPSINWAMLLAEKNGFADRIVFHYSDARNMDIGEKADVIVSELIGHLAFEEGMAETIFDAKKRFLKLNGALIPASVTLHAALVYEQEIYSTYINGPQNSVTPHHHKKY
jgi:predicted RNA methylase